MFVAVVVGYGTTQTIVNDVVATADFPWVVSGATPIYLQRPDRRYASFPSVADYRFRD